MAFAEKVINLGADNLFRAAWNRHKSIIKHSSARRRAARVSDKRFSAKVYRLGKYAMVDVPRLVLKK